MSASLDDIRLDKLPVEAGEDVFARAVDSLRNDVIQVPPRLLPSQWIFDNVELENGESSKAGKVRLRG